MKYKGFKLVKDMIFYEGRIDFCENVIKRANKWEWNLGGWRVIHGSIGKLI